MSNIYEYELDKTVIATVCSHSALQIFLGAKNEGFPTLGITVPERKRVYESFIQVTPDDYIEVESFQQLIDKSVQEALLKKNAIAIPHGSFVEYIGGENILNNFYVPVFGNKKSLIWEASRKKVDEWMRLAKLKVPRYIDPDEIDSLCIVKMGGAKGGKGFFLVSSEDEFFEKLGSRNVDEVVIQEYVVGVRYYHHFFNSVVRGRVEFLGVDQRLESNVDGLHRIQSEIEPSYTITGNAPVVLRESLLPRILEMGESVVKTSMKLFPPGITGPFCIETICTPNLEFYAFEISARIVAGTNIYPSGSQYSCYYFKEPMSTGRRIARELKEAIQEGIIERVVS